MLSIFKFLKKKKQKASHSSSYYEQENLIASVNNLVSIYERTPSLTTQNHLLFQDLHLDQINMENMEEKLGEESYILDNTKQITGHHVYFYRKYADKFNLVLQVHFLHGQFFFAATKIGAGAHISASEKQTIAQTVLKRFPDVTIPENGLEFEIMDVEGNILYSTDQLYYYLNYALHPDKNKHLKSLMNDNKSNQGLSNKENENLKRFL